MSKIPNKTETASRVSRPKLNVDQKLINLAAQFRRVAFQNSKSARAQRQFVRGKAWKLVNEHYPINRDAVWGEFQALLAQEVA